MNAAALSLYERYASKCPEKSDEQVVVAICEDLVLQGEVGPPVDVGLVASLCGICETREHSTGPSGMLMHADVGWVASTLTWDSPERKRFTLMHEAGHTLMPDFKRGGSYHRCKGRRDRTEELCDVAAAELLLPRRFFAPDIRDAPPGLAGVERLAKRYQASIQATALRVTRLADTPTALLTFQLGVKASERDQPDAVAQLRLAWAWTPDGWPPIRRNKSVAYGSPFTRALAGEEVEALVGLDELFVRPVGEAHVTARRYGDAVLALVTPTSPGRN